MIMKRNLSLIFFSLIMVMLPASVYADNDRLFSKVAELPGVESIYIGSDAMNSANQKFIQSIALGGIHNCLKSIESVELIDCNKSDEHDSYDKVKKFVGKVIKKLHLKVSMETIDEGEYTRVYTGAPKKGSGTGSLLFEYFSEDECIIIYVIGEIDLSGIEKNGKAKPSSDK